MIKSGRRLGVVSWRLRDAVYSLEPIKCGKYLIDDTGNRRFKPVVVGNLNFEVSLRQDRVQLFAEAKYLFDHQTETEITLELTGKAKVFEAKIHGEKMIEDESSLMYEAMQDFILKIERGEASFDFTKFRIMDLFSGVGALQKWQATNRNSQFAAKMLRNLGGESHPIKGYSYWKLPRVGGFDGSPPTKQIDQESYI